ncbi:MAG: glycosyltransferase family 2 protein [Bacteroidota bacterium]
MLVSIITPSYNSSKHIAATIESILDQSYTDWEHIIIDDASADDSLEIVKQYSAKDARIKYIGLSENRGVANARNQGLKFATGKFITFLDSDDLWDSSKLEKQINFMLKNNFRFTHTAYRKINSEGAVVANKIGVSPVVNYNKLLKHNEIGCLTVMCDAEVIGKHSFSKIGHEDFALWLKILKDGHLSHGLDEVLASYRVHGNTLSSNKLKSSTFTWNILRNEEKLPLHRAVYNFLFYATNSMWKYLKK